MLSLLSIARSAMSVEALISGGALGNALDAIAGVEFDAAKNALQAVKLSNKPREALNRALTHLESAHNALVPTWSNKLSKYTRGIKAFIQLNWMYMFAA
jgi:hypothetical protein